MKITNKYNLPQTLVNVVERPEYTRGKAHISATGLLSSPRIVQLQAKYDDQIEIDVSSMIWSIFGTAIHSILEHGKDANHIVEQRLHAELDGWHISGAIDLQVVNDNGVSVSDYKTISIWSVMNDKPEWEQQLNIYAWLVETVKKMTVTDLSIIGIIRDWSERESKIKQGYPVAPIVTLPIRLWPMEEREEFIRNRIHLHSEGLFATDANEELPLCSPSEMWEKPTMYAVKKEGGVRAKSVHGNLDEAEAALEKAGKGYQLEIREGGRTKCDNYCQVSKFCNQYQQYLEEKNG